MSCCETCVGELSPSVNGVSYQVLYSDLFALVGIRIVDGNASLAAKLSSHFINVYVVITELGGERCD